MSNADGMTTLEQASRCPKCDQPGRFMGDRSLEVGQGKLKMFQCENARCRWFNTQWPVQVSSNGTVPMTLVRPKQFGALPDDGGRTLSAMESVHKASMEPGGGEVRRRGY
jgi:hypothetical protein